MTSLTMLRAYLAQAQQMGDKTINVPVDELAEIIGRVDYQKKQIDAARSSQLVGFVCEDKMKLLLSGQDHFLKLYRRRRGNFQRPLYMRDLVTPVAETPTC